MHGSNSNCRIDYYFKLAKWMTKGQVQVRVLMGALHRKLFISRYFIRLLILISSIWNYTEKAPNEQIDGLELVCCLYLWLLNYILRVRMWCVMTDSTKRNRYFDDSAKRNTYFDWFDNKHAHAQLNLMCIMFMHHIQCVVAIIIFLRLYTTPSTSRFCHAHTWVSLWFRQFEQQT